nr:hypothetical protein [Mycoplasmopsis bovis]
MYKIVNKVCYTINEDKKKKIIDALIEAGITQKIETSLKKEN